MVELFFDLVFVFAVTQLSHTLLAELTLDNLVRVTVLFLAVWLVWMYTAWMTNWLDPQRLQVRITLFVLILVGLFMSVSIPHSFAERGIVFAAAYVTTQVGRALFVLWTMRREAPRLAQTFQRIAVWMSLSGVLWIVGAFAEPDVRLAWWTLALGIEMFGPWALYWVPGLGRSAVADWNVDGGHMAERCGLFIIIALAILGGPACYLLGAAWFKWLTNDRRTPPLSHVVGIALIALLAWPALTHAITPLVCGIATTLVFAVVAFWETVALSAKRQAGTVTH
jgi:low temperature requirement protein LtrA